MTADLTLTDHRLADALMRLPGVVAVAIGGSRASGLDDAGSDTDAYAFHTSAPGLDQAAATARHAALAPLADGGDVVESTAWGLENHLHVDGRLVEVMHLEVDDIGRTIDRAWSEGLFDEGYPTAFLHTVATCVPMADDGTLAALKQRLDTYPDATRSRLLAGLPEFLDGYLKQLAAAQSRDDLPSLAHRLGHFVDVWFNLLFAVNRAWQPGEKRLLVHAARLPVQPDRMQERWRAVLERPLTDDRLVPELSALVSDLVALGGATP